MLGTWYVDRYWNTPTELAVNEMSTCSAMSMTWFTAHGASFVNECSSDYPRVVEVHRHAASR